MSMMYLLTFKSGKINFSSCRLDSNFLLECYFDICIYELEIEKLAKKFTCNFSKCLYVYVCPYVYPYLYTCMCMYVCV